MQNTQTIELYPEYSGQYSNSTTPFGFMNSIVGYDDVKKLIKMAIDATKPVHILFNGVPGSAKTLFLLELRRLLNSEYIIAGTSSKVGIIENLIRERPEFFLVDELEKARNTELSVLLSLMETGIIKVTKHNKHIEDRLHIKVFAACNSTKRISAELLSRFQFKINFKRYTREEFIKITIRVLQNSEDTPLGLAKYIAVKLSDYTFDVRRAVGIARTCSNTREIDNVIFVLNKYNGV